MNFIDIITIVGIVVLVDLIVDLLVLTVIRWRRKTQEIENMKKNIEDIYNMLVDIDDSMGE